MSGNFMTQVGDDGWTEIVGASAGNQALVSGDDYQVLGAQLAQNLVQNSPAFRNYVAQQAASQRPILRKTMPTRARDWDISFGPVSGAAGTTTTISNTPACLFKGMRLVATDTASPAGTGTRITQIFIGQRLQRPVTGGGTLTAFLAANAFGVGIEWDTCQPAYSISMTVSFVSACTFDAAVFGKAVVG